MAGEPRAGAGPRIAIWGNMNNMGFSLLRYFRDLGADAYLFPYSNDGRDLSAHFAPEADSWEFDRWKTYIEELPFPDAQISALDPPLSWALSAKSRLRGLVHGTRPQLASVGRQKLRELVKDFDHIVGSGIAPAVLQRIDRALDVFAPYASQIEYMSSFDFDSGQPTSSFLAAKVNHLVKTRQMEGVRSARKIVSFEQVLNGPVLQQVGRQAERLAIPMVYVETAVPNAVPSPHLISIYDRIKASDYAVLHHARLLWSKPDHISDAQWRLESKNSHWVFQAFADVIRARPGSKPLLIAVEYGPDVANTKRLCENLGITNYMHWVKVMPRREAMWLLTKVDAGIGEFYESQGMIWGGTGWEVMAMARPLIQGFNFEDGTFEATFGCSPPPFLKVKRPADVTRHLLTLMDDRAQGTLIGRSCRSWFDAHNGQGLAQRWLDLICGESDQSVHQIM